MIEDISITIKNKCSLCKKPMKEMRPHYGWVCKECTIALYNSGKALIK